MNISVFLTPKSQVVCIDHDTTMREALKRMEQHGYTAVPLLDNWVYVGTLTEGDLLWYWNRHDTLTLDDMEDVQVSEIPRNSRSILPVQDTAKMEELFALSASQNFVPVVDERQVFIGIVRRSFIINYCIDMMADSNPDVFS